MYRDGDLQETTQFDPAAILDHLQRQYVVWLDVTGLSSGEFMNQLADIFKIHRLALEDVIHTHQRPKVDIYDEHLFMTMSLPVAESGFTREQISLFLGQNYVLTIKEHSAGVFEPIRERIRQNVGKIRKSGADYLVYALTDVVIDHYFPIIEERAVAIDQLEERLLQGLPTEGVREIHLAKEAMAEFNRTIWNHSELVKSLIRNPGNYFDEGTIVYLRDCYDHSLQLLEYSGTYREATASLLDLHLLIATHKSNEVMKFLTICMSIFIPLTFIAGVYGMNFHNMPEIHWEYGYAASLILMGAVAVGMLIYFKRKGWLKISS